MSYLLVWLAVPAPVYHKTKEGPSNGEQCFQMVWLSQLTQETSPATPPQVKPSSQGQKLKLCESKLLYSWVPALPTVGKQTCSCGCHHKNPNRSFTERNIHHHSCFKRIILLSLMKLKTCTFNTWPFKIENFAVHNRPFLWTDNTDIW